MWILAGELIETGGHMPEVEKEFHIFVNTKPRTVPGPSISFEKVLELAGINLAGQDPNLYDVEWVLGHRTGTLSPGQSVPLENGMRFDAGKSNRS
jgi:hypothetical protein